VQLSHKGKIASALAAATCALVPGAVQPSVAQEDQPGSPWKVDLALMHYGEADRIACTTVQFMIGRSYARERALTFGFSYDSLTGPSANGAQASAVAQTFTTPSGNGVYTAGAGVTPLDPTFLDTRWAVNANWAQPLSRKWSWDAGLSFSTEYDYTHTGVNTRLARSFDRHNSTLSAALAVSADAISPVGGAPLPLAPMLEPGQTGNKLGDDDKTVFDLVVGWTQVIDRRTLAQLNYSLSSSTGYLTDPYKLVSVVDPAAGLPVAGPGSLNLYRFESRPDSRTRHGLYAQVRHQLRRDIVDVSYRYYTDDWSVRSHTLEARYRWKMLPRAYLEPHVRYYDQSEAEFYVTTLVEGAPLPDYATSDYRLGAFTAYTVGAKFGFAYKGLDEISLRLEYYNQSGDSSPAGAVGAQRGLDMFPTVEAVVFQLGFKFDLFDR
jgi:hypothetical protein